MKYKFKPYSNNIVFFDTEFSINDHKSAELLSLGMVDMKGKELYLEFNHKKPVSDWVKKNIIPTLNNKKTSKKDARKLIQKFAGKGKPHLLAFVYAFDILCLENLFGWDKLSELFTWPPLDFASVLYGNNISPRSYYEKDKDNFFDEIGIDREKFGHTHNALDDAKLLREVYLKMTKKYNNK